MRWPGSAVPAVQDLSLAIRAGEVVALLGASGSGKTTALKTINRLVEPTGGIVAVDGVDVRSRDAIGLRRGIGYVFQGVGLFPHLSVGENVAVVPRLLGWPRDVIATRVAELLAMVGLDPDEYGSRRPDQLSGGESQRVGFARALAVRPSILLLDEPFSALDPLVRAELQAHFRRLHRDLGFTAVLVTHDMSEALLLADRVAVLQSGRLVGLGAPRDLVRDPGHDHVRELLGAPRQTAALLEDLLRESGA